MAPHLHIGGATILELAALGIFAGWLGAVVGIGGGVVVVPVLVLAFGFDTRVAVASSLVAVVATSVAAGSAYVGAGQTNMRLALVLEIATTVGGLLGGVVAVLLAPTVIDGLFAVIILVTSALVLKGQGEAEAGPPDHATGGREVGRDGAGQVGTDDDGGGGAVPGAAREGAGGGAAVPELVGTGARVGWEERGHLGGGYLDPATGALVVYRVVRLWIGWAVSFLAGLVSGLLGVGGGFLKVPAMHLGMKVPLKVSAATSNFMIGVTAVTSLFVYFARGFVVPLAAAPIALGIAAGAYVGAKTSQRVSNRALGRILGVVLVVVAVQMGLKAFGVTYG